MRLGLMRYLRCFDGALLGLSLVVTASCAGVASTVESGVGIECVWEAQHLRSGIMVWMRGLRRASIAI